MTVLPVLGVRFFLNVLAFLFVICAIALILIILIQKGKGGGLSGALAAEWPAIFSAQRQAIFSLGLPSACGTGFWFCLLRWLGCISRRFMILAQQLLPHRAYR